MPTNIVVPPLGESIVDARVARWLKQTGDRVAAGDPLVELETDKVNLEVGAPSAGVLKDIAHREGDDVKIGDVLGTVEPGEAPADRPGDAGSQHHQAPPTPPPASPADTSAETSDHPAPPPAAPTPPAPATPVPAPAISAPPPAPTGDDAVERVRMSKRRATIAKRLVEGQRAAAMLTTFNEVDMSAVRALRARQQEAFTKAHGVRLGLTSFFVKAAIAALRAWPRLNAEIDGDVMLLKHYYDIGVAVSADEGLVVPVLRAADRMTFADIERKIHDYAARARDGSLVLDDLRGGSFTITNGGVFGSLLSTPILNPPQSGILGLHAIQDRPVGVDGQIVLRPMMYVALSYDHRIVDGAEAVRFLVRVKTLVEDPAALMIES